jgi:hypothetical protein
MLAVIPSAASADVPRCEASVTTGTTVKTATFTALQPRDTVGQFTNVWKHDFTVIVNSDNTFSGTGNVYGPDGSVAWTESITGSFGVNTVSFDTTPNAGATFRVVNAPYNTTVIAETTWAQNIIEMRMSEPVFTTATTTTPGTESVKNHGQYVKALGGGKVAAQACAGMPVNSTQGSN